MFCKKRPKAAKAKHHSVSKLYTVMQIKIFTIPVYSNEQEENNLNKFLHSHRVLQTERHFCPDNGGYWTILVEFMEGDPVDVPPANRKDRRDVSKELDDVALARFERFKSIRREIATQKGIPAYLIFTNEELAILAKMPKLSKEIVGSIKGIAPSRLKENISYFCDIEDGETSGQPHDQDC